MKMRKSERLNLEGLEFPNSKFLGIYYKTKKIMDLGKSMSWCFQKLSHFLFLIRYFRFRK
jgi:hypothetical protein